MWKGYYINEIFISTGAQSDVALDPKGFMHKFK